MNLAAMLKPAAKEAGRQPFLAFAADASSREVLADLANAKSWPPTAIREGGIDDAVVALQRIPSPERLVVDLDETDDPLSAVNRLADVCEPGTAVVALGTVNDIALYRELIEAGLTDYLLKPFDADALEQALTPRPEEQVRGGDDDKQSRLIVVIGVRGGVGASMVALNSAWIMAHEQKRRVALVDLDLQFGSVALSFDLDPGRGLREAVENPGRIDGLFIERAMIRESDNLFILGAEEPLDSDVMFDEVAIDLLFGQLGEHFQCVVADMPRSSAPMHQRLLAGAQRIVLVTDLSLAGMRDVVRLSGLVKSCAPEAALTIVANRVGGDRDGLKKAEFEKGFDGRIEYLIPDDRKSVAASLNAGKPLPRVAARSKIVGVLRKLSRSASGARPTPQDAPLWRRLVK